MISCLEKLFDVEGLLIYEDFLEIHELVEIQTKFKDRANPLNHSIDVIDEEFLEASSQKGFDENFWTYYQDNLAFLSSESPISYYRILDRFGFRLEEAWILGANSVDISRIHSNPELNCDEYTCYQKTLSEGKICKLGKFFLFDEFELRLKNHMQKKKTLKAIRIEEDSFFGISIPVLMIVIVAYMLSSAMVDLILRKFSLSQNNKMKSTSITQKATLVFCLAMYFAGGMTLFRKRFEVNDVRL